MKRILLLIVLLINTVWLFAQVPEEFNYQAVIKDQSGQIIANQNISVRINILQGIDPGTSVYEEIHELTSTSEGVINLQIGSEDETGSFAEIDWSINNHYLKIDIDKNGNADFINIGTFQLLSVPYALYSKKSRNANHSLTSDNTTNSTYAIYADTSQYSVKADTANIANKLNEDVLYFTDSDTLFAVKDRNGNIVFAVFNDGVKVYVNEGSKGNVGGFAVSGRGTGKATEYNVLSVTPDSARFYLNETTKGMPGGFAVSGRGTGKGIINNYLQITQDSTRIYINENATKGMPGGFAVSGRGTGKGIKNEYLQVTPDSTKIYINESTKGQPGGFAVSGRGTGKRTTTDYFNISGDQQVDTINSEARILWYPKKEAFMAGRVIVESVDSVGTNSLATGFESKAIGDFSQAFGYKAKAKGNYSSAIGLESKALGLNSFAFGQQAEAIGEGSYAFGSLGLDIFGGGFQGKVNTKAMGYASISIGLGAISIGEGAIAFGICDTAMGDYSKAMGHGSIASGPYSTTIGLDTKAEGYHSYAFGRVSKALAQDAISFAGESTASGIYSVSLGAQSVASGDYSTTLGMNTRAEEGASVAMGTDTKATGWGSVTMGYNTIAKPRTLLVIGRNNDTTCISEGFGWWNSLDPAFIIGNGIDNENRSNAFTVLQNGNTAIGHEAPTEMLDVNGNARFRSVGTSNNSNMPLYITSTGVLSTAASDIRLKTNINNLENSLVKISKLRGVSFNWKEDPNGKRNIGFIAQEVEKIFPELVFENNVDGYKGVNYAEMSAVLVEAVKEQQEQINDLKSENELLKQKLNEIIKLLNKE